VKALKEMKVHVAINTEGNVLFIVPTTKAVGKLAETKIMTARLYTQEEIDREYEEAMQLGCRRYKRFNRRVREIK
jgi:hypothetical protein